MRLPLQRVGEKVDPLLSDVDVSRITGRARSSLQKDRLAGNSIPFIRIGGQVRYRPEDVARYLAELPTFRSTSEAAGGEILSPAGIQVGELLAAAGSRAAPERMGAGYGITSKASTHTQEPPEEGL